MIFNGHTIQNIDALDEATMNEIVVMYSDGALGNKSSLVTLATLTAGVFNYLRAKNSSPYDLKKVLGQTYAYYYPDIEISPSEALLSFMSQAQGFDINKFKGK